MKKHLTKELRTVFEIGTKVWVIGHRPYVKGRKAVVGPRVYRATVEKIDILVQETGNVIRYWIESCSVAPFIPYSWYDVFLNRVNTEAELKHRKLPGYKIGDLAALRKRTNQK